MEDSDITSRFPTIAQQHNDPHHFQHLKRQLGLLQLTMIGIGGSIGSGVFTLTGLSAQRTGPAVILSYLFAGMIAVIDAYCYAEQSSRYPLSGTVFLFCHIAFGELPALLIAMNLLLDYHVAASLIARSFAMYLVEFLRSTGLELPSWVSSFSINNVISISFVAPLLLLLLTVVLCRGAKWGAWLNLVLTMMKMIVIFIVCGVGFFYVDSSNWTPFFPLGFQAVFPTSATVFFSYVGFDTIASSAEESKNPRRDLPLAIMLSLTVCVAFYCFVCLVLTGMLPYNEIDLAAPLSSAFRNVGQKWLEPLIAFGGVVGLATTLLIGLYAQSRVYLSLGRDGLLPPLLADVHPEFNTPMKAQLLCGAIAILMSMFFNVKILSEILDIGVIVGYGSVCASVLVTRKGRRDKQQTTRKIIFLIFTACIPLALLKFRVFSVPISCGFFLLPLLALIPLIYGQEYPAPCKGGEPSFSTPLVPYIPLAGILLNVYLASNLHPWAWLRLVILWSIMLVYYIWTEKKIYNDRITGTDHLRGGGGALIRRRQKIRECPLPPEATVQKPPYLFGADVLLRRRKQSQQHADNSHPLRKVIMEDAV